MATRIEDKNGSRIVGSHIPLGVALAVIPQLSRPLLALVIDRAIEHLDGLAGDPDLEPSGDEQDGTNAEDEFQDNSRHGNGPGCTISDPDCCRVNEDRGTEEGGSNDGRPGDAEDAEEGGDMEQVGLVFVGGSES